MNFSLFYQLLESDWNHGNAHYLRGVVSELQELGHRVRVFDLLSSSFPIAADSCRARHQRL